MMNLAFRPIELLLCLILHILLLHVGMYLVEASSCGIFYF
jgi:hypothetical protein